MVGKLFHCLMDGGIFIYVVAFVFVYGKKIILLKRKRLKNNPFFEENNPQKKILQEADSSRCVQPKSQLCAIKKQRKTKKNRTTKTS